MGFFGAFLADQAGRGKGAIDRQKDDQALAETQAKELQRQKELAEANAEHAREFDASNAIDVSRDKRAQSTFDREQSQWKPGDKKGFPGGFLWQQAQQKLAQGKSRTQLGPLEVDAARLKNRASEIGNQGAVLGNESTAIANRWAPVLNGLRVQADRVTIANAAGRTYANEKADRAAELKAAQDSAYRIAAYKVAVKGSNPQDKAKAYQAALKAVTSAGNALKGGTKDLGGVTKLYFTPEQQAKIEQNAAEIDSSPDPIEAANRAIQLLAQKQVPNAPLIADYLLSRANAAYIRQSNFGTAPPQPTQLNTPIQGLNFPPLPGGSKAANPF